MKLGIIGTGKMGCALLEGLLKASVVSPDRVVAFDAFEEALESCATKFEVTRATSNDEVLTECDCVLLCVKPQVVQTVLEDLDHSLPERLLVSIVAGASISSLAGWTARRHRLVRVMPNTPALIGEGASAYALSASATEKDSALVRSILESVGLAFEVPESQLDAVTALSGSGPAYVFTMIEALTDGAVQQGLPRQLALKLAAQTVAGSAELVLRSELHPAVLRDQVTSPAGTTIAGMCALEQGGFRAAILEAVSAAADRSRELGD